MSRIYKRVVEIEEAPLGPDLMLFNPDTSKFFVLNPTMAHLWKNCDGVNGTDMLVTSLSGVFTGTDDVAVGDEVEAALSQMLEMGVVDLVKSEA